MVMISRGTGRKNVTYSVTNMVNDWFKRTKEAIMPFELIMLLGFLGTALLGLLPAAPARVADESFRGRRAQRRSDGERRGADRGRRMTRGRDAIRLRNAGRAAV